MFIVGIFLCISSIELISMSQIMKQTFLYCRVISKPLWYEISITDIYKDMDIFKFISHLFIKSLSEFKLFSIYYIRIYIIYIEM